MAYGMYTSILSTLVDTFTTPFQQKRIMSLDSPVSSDSEATLHDRIGIEDRVLKSLISKARGY